MIITSNEDLNKYISCKEGSSFPPVDFSKHSLLLVSGKTDRDIDEILVKRFKQLSADTFKLKIEIALRTTIVYKQFFEYNKALLIEKMNDESIVELNVTLKEPKIIHPVSVTDEKITYFFGYAFSSHYEPHCLLTSIPQYKDTCFMINSRYELEQVNVCADMLPDIDFENYTLIIGKHVTSSIPFFVEDQKVFESSVLTLFVRKNNGGGLLCVGNMFHWGIYPKLPNKPFYVEYKN